MSVPPLRDCIQAVDRVSSLSDLLHPVESPLFNMYPKRPLFNRIAPPLQADHFRLVVFLEPGVVVGLGLLIGCRFLLVASRLLGTACQNAGAGVLAGGAKQAGRNQQKAASNQQSQANYNARLQEYNKAKMVCLEGRGYTVK